MPVWSLWRKCRCLVPTEIRTPDHSAQRLVTVLLITLFRLTWYHVVLQKFILSQLFFPADGGNRLLWDIGSLPDYVASCPRRQYFSLCNVITWSLGAWNGSLSAAPPYILCSVFLLSPHCTQQLYNIEIVHLLGRYSMIAVVFGAVIKETLSVMFRKTVLFTGNGKKVKVGVLN